MSKLTRDQEDCARDTFNEADCGMTTSERMLAAVEAVLNMEAPASAPVEQPAQSGASEQTGMVDRMNEAYATVFRSEAEPSGGWAHTAMTAALNVALDAMEKEIQDEGDRISWQGFGAETTFAKAVRSRLSAPVRDPAVEAVKALWLQTDGNASAERIVAAIDAARKAER